MIVSFHFIFTFAHRTPTYAHTARLTHPNDLRTKGDVSHIGPATTTKRH